MKFSHHINQKDARILREALAKIAKMRLTQASPVALEALTQFALGVGAYCQHPEFVLLPTGQKNACLDCGKRWDPILPPATEWPDSSGV